MKCQFCKQNNADRVFYVNWMGALYQIAVCNSCLERMWHQAAASGQEEAFKTYSGWWPGKPDPRRPGERPFPEEAAADLKQKRRLAVLRLELAAAANSENYEEAAKLRDDIAAIEREVCPHEH